MGYTKQSERPEHYPIAAFDQFDKRPPVLRPRGQKVHMEYGVTQLAGAHSTGMRNGMTRLVVSFLRVHSPIFLGV